MPWKASDAESHTKKADTPAKQKTWAQIANKERQRCMGEGGDAEECDARAIRVANAAVAKIKEADMLYKAHTTSTNNVLISVNAIDVDGEPVPVAELVAAYEEQRGQGQGQGGERQGDGGAGICVCPKCEREFPHERGTPCNERKCPDCGVALTGKSSTEEVAKIRKVNRVNLGELLDDVLKEGTYICPECGKATSAQETKCPYCGILFTEATTKTIDGKKYPASDFLVVEDSEQPSTWHLQVKRNGKPDHGLMGGAKAALTSPGGHRGNKYQGPKKQEAISKLKALYKSEDMAWDGETSEADIDRARELLEQALTALGNQQELAEVELAESAVGHAVALEETGKVADGPRAPLTMEVALIKPGFGNKKDNHYYPPDVLRRDIHVFEGVKMYATDHRQDEKSVRTEVAVIKTCPSRFLGDGTPIALAAVHDGDFAEQARNREKLGTLESLECSILGNGRIKKGNVDGQKANIVEAIVKGQSVDWVTKGGAGGHAHSLAENEGGVMLDKETVEGLLTESDLSQEVQERLAGAEYEDEGAVKEAILKEQAQGQEELQQLAGAEITKVLSETNLPSVAKGRLARGEYEDESALREAILAEVEYVKTLTGSGQPFAQGGRAQQEETKPLSERLDAIDVRYGLRALTEQEV